jgi:dinuclear metal center YbgI/SA1388 family protein
MTQKRVVVDFLDSYLNTKSFIDYSANGLQIDGKDEIKKIGFSVDACLDVFEKATKEKCDMIIVHHGLFWDKIGPITKELYPRIKCLIENNISLYASHAPIDKHNIIGNNAQLLKMFGLKPKSDFGFDHGISWSYMDELKNTIDIKKAIDIMNNLAKKYESDVRIFKFGPDKIRKIGVVSGGGSFAIKEAIEKKCDLFITGEVKHSNYHEITEGKLNVIAAGHYATETLGVIALSKVVEKRLKVRTVFINSPTGL